MRRAGGRDGGIHGHGRSQLEGTPPTRIGEIDLASGDMRLLTFGPNTDRLPKYSPDGRHIAFLSDRHRLGSFQLYLLNVRTGVALAAPSVPGWVEYFHWAPDGERILLGVAANGADMSSGHGGFTTQIDKADMPAWVPAVASGREQHGWRGIWTYVFEDNLVRPIPTAGANVWEAVWCGNDCIAAVVSPGPNEGLWYTAHLDAISITTGDRRHLYKPQAQLGWPSASPSGKRIAFVEAICSDWWVVAGDLWLIDLDSDRQLQVDTHGVDITYIEWRTDRHVLVAGHRGFESVVGLYDAVAHTFTETWASSNITTGGRYITVSGFGAAADCALIGENYIRAPEIAVLHAGNYKTVKSLDVGHDDQFAFISSTDRVTWRAPDGQAIQGWLLVPKGVGPHPLVMNLHGGPVWHWRPTWLGRDGIHLLMLLKRGYAILLPNPRGSSGRGQSFARQVVGEMGGADTFDCLSGIDHFLERGIVDPKRLGVMGRSYGGFMTSWLITRDLRFAAAIQIAPATNHVSAHLLSNIPDFVDLFLADSYTNINGKYFSRSPIMYAKNAKTPTLIICGALDRCTPAEEATQFHHALLQNNVESVLITYPQEGHGVRKMPAVMDFGARVVGWFEDHFAKVCVGDADAKSACPITRGDYESGQ